MKDKGHENKLIYIASVIMTIAMLFSLSSGNKLLILLAYALLAIGLFRPEFLIPTYFVVSLSSNYFVATQGVGINRLMAFIIIFGVIIRILRQGKVFITKWIYGCIFIAMVTLISFLQAYTRSVTSIYTIGLNILIFLAMTNLKLDEAELARLFQSVLFAVFITTAFFLVQYLLNPNILISGRLTISDNVNTNDFAMMMAQLSAYSFAYIYFTEKPAIKKICFIVGLINTYFVLLSGSRSALIGITLGVLVSIIIFLIKQKKNVKNFIFGAGVFVICILVFYFLIESNPALAYRMDISQVVETGGTSRWPRIVAEVKYVISEHFLFGVGPSSVNETIVLASYMARPGSSHNFIISALTQVGIIGFVAYMGFYWKIVKETILKLNSYRILIIPLTLITTAFFNGIGEVVYSTRFFWNTLSLAVICLSTYYNKNTLKQGDVSGPQNQTFNIMV